MGAVISNCLHPDQLQKRVQPHSWEFQPLFIEWASILFLIIVIVGAGDDDDAPLNSHIRVNCVNAFLHYMRLFLNLELIGVDHLSHFIGKRSHRILLMLALTISISVMLAE